MASNPSQPALSNDPLSQVLKVTDCNRVDFLIESRTYESLLKVVPPFGPRCTFFEDSDPWKVTVWTPDPVNEIKATLVELRDHLVPAGYKDFGMPKHIGALAYTMINGEPAFPELATAIETIRRVSDTSYWKHQGKTTDRELVSA